YKKTRSLEEGEVVICTVKKILPHAVFVDLDEYEQEAMIHISEIAPGRIRNLRDYVKEGKKIICRVLSLDKAKGYVDLSLRRVTQAQKISKNNYYKQEQKSEKILEDVAKSLKTDLKTIYEKAGDKIIEKYDGLMSCFNEIVNNNLDLKKLGIESKLADKITELVKDKIKPPEVTISGVLKIESDASNGIEIIKNTLKQVKQDENIKVTYLSAPNYRIIVKSKDYKTAESIIKNISNNVIENIKKFKGRAEFIRS
ncbi:MAG: translation initiation factor IF-2 subunit alpha, partial [Nanoarchaeota archaeon]